VEKGEGKEDGGGSEGRESKEGKKGRTGERLGESRRGKKEKEGRIVKRGAIKREMLGGGRAMQANKRGERSIFEGGTGRTVEGKEGKQKDKC